MVGDKGVNELISAYSLFKQKYSNTILLLVGKFEEQRDPLKKVTLDIIKDNDDIAAVAKVIHERDSEEDETETGTEIENNDNQ